MSAETEKTHSTDMPIAVAGTSYWSWQLWGPDRVSSDEDSFVLMSHLLEFDREIRSRIARVLQDEDLQTTDFYILMFLRSSDTGAELISQLARSLLIHATTATLAIDRLQRRDMLIRTPHPTDRRATHVSLTRSGQQLVTRAFTALRQIEFGLAGTTEADQRGLFELVRRLSASATDADSGTASRRSA
jgi:DNA-binding MarR family transcriptional regulator